MSFNKQASPLYMSAQPPSGSPRRQVIQEVGLASLGVILGLNTASSNALAAEGGSGAPIAVIGARGQTGRLIVKDLLQAGKAVRAISYRELKFDPKDLEGATGKIEYAIGDVTKPESLSSAVAGASAAIFASSASKKGGNAKEVDYKGVENVARACVENKVPKLVIISSGAVTRPESIGFKVTNLFGNIMEYKLLGENKVREIYADAPRGVSYTIVRPGGLTKDSVRGVSALEINQGDFIIGEVGRADLAKTVVAALETDDTNNVTFELFETGRRYPLQPNFPTKSGNEHYGSTYSEIFKGLKTDKALGQSA